MNSLKQIIIFVSLFKLARLGNSDLTGIVKQKIEQTLNEQKEELTKEIGDVFGGYMGSNQSPSE